MSSDRYDLDALAGSDDALIKNARRQIGQMGGFLGDDGKPLDGGSSASARMARYFPEIEGYRITGILGHGGMGIVYRAEQIALHRMVALKVLPAIVSTVSPSAVTRFRREANAAARLHHTNIIPIYDFGESNDTYYFAMELIAGKPLNSIIPQLAENNVSSVSPARFARWLQMELVGATGPAEDTAPSGHSASQSDSSFGSSTAGKGRAYFHHVARWMADVADALNYAHDQHVIHRDIKPGNLILSPDFRIMIADFGLAKVADDESFTMTGTLVGTLRYLSPEQAMAKRVRLDHRTDIYSLGATMYELLCFQSAYQGRDQKEILAAIIARDPVPPQRINTVVPAELSTICLKCMEKLPESRYATAKALAEDLRRYLQDLPIVAKRPGPIRRAGKFLRRHRAVAIAVVAGLVVTGSASFLQYRKNKQAALVAAHVASEAASIAAQVADEAAQIAEQQALSDQHVALGERLAKQGEFQLAEKEYLEALDLNPRNVDAWSNLAILKKDMYNALSEPNPSLLQEALDHCDKAFSLEPDHPRNQFMWNVRGVVFKKLERFEEAAQSYERALELDPNHSQAYENLGVIRALLFDLDSAEENLLRATEIAGTRERQCEYPWRDLVALELHLARREAYDHIESAMKCNDKDPDSWLFRARTYLEITEYRNIDDALRYAQGADILAEGKNTKIKRILATAYLEKNEFESAIREASAAIALGDMKTVNHLIQAAASVQLGKREQAEEHLAAADKHWPAALREKGSYLPSAPKGILWFESADSLYRLKRRADDLLKVESGRPSG